MHACMHMYIHHLTQQAGVFTLGFVTFCIMMKPYFKGKPHSVNTRVPLDSHIHYYLSPDCMFLWTAGNKHLSSSSNI